MTDLASRQRAASCTGFWILANTAFNWEKTACEKLGLVHAVKRTTVLSRSNKRRKY